MRIITLEEHFATPRFFDGPGRDLKEQAEKFNSPRALKLIRSFATSARDASRKWTPPASTCRSCH
jgi:hypothetical protein